MRRTEKAGAGGGERRLRNDWSGNSDAGSRRSITNTVTNGAAINSCAVAGLAAVTRGSVTSGRHACMPSPVKAAAGALSWWQDASLDAGRSFRHSNPQASNRPDAASITTMSRWAVQRSVTTFRL
jgi:hypothetical protein